MSGKNSKLNLDELIGKKVEVYYNLHKKTFSVKFKGIVHLHANTLTMENCTFKVLQSGRRRVLESKQKNIHAFVVGILTGATQTEVTTPRDSNRISYNPYKHNQFFYVTDKEHYDSILNTKHQLLLQSKNIFEITNTAQKISLNS